MKYYLDTNMCIYFLKGKYEAVRKHLLDHHPDDIKICSMVKAELLYGAEKSKRRDENIEKVNEFLFPFEIVPFDNTCVTSYAGIRSNLEKNGSIIGPNDLIIASTIIGNDGILVTNNEKEFKRIENLKIENWIN